jgi:hypothetical protein
MMDDGRHQNSGTRHVVGVGLRRSLRALPRAGRAGGGRLLARSLRDPEVAAWRKRLLGAGAPWEPVLFAVEGAEAVRALTGRRLVLGLVRLLGVRRGLALARGLGDLASPAGAGPVLTRRRALGRLAGVGTALGLLVSEKLAVPGGVHAQGAGEERPWWALEPIKTSLLDPAAREKLLAELVAGPDLPAVLGAAELAEVQAAEHWLADGRTLWALAGVLPDDEVVVAYRDDAGRVEALRYRVVGEVAELRAVSAGGVVQYPLGAGGGDFSPASCPPGTWPCRERRCCRVHVGAALGCCWSAACDWPCLRNQLLCIACLLITCAWCVSRACVWWCNCCWNDPPWGP